MACVVEGCKSHSSRKQNTQELLTFHRFPRDNVIQSEWINRIGRRNWTPKSHSHICSKHFTLNSFTKTENMKWRRLKENAVPTLFIMDGTGETEVFMEVCKEEEEEEDGHSAVQQIQGSVQRHKQFNSYLTGRQNPIPMEDFEAGSIQFNKSAQPLTSSEVISHQSQMARTHSEIHFTRRIEMLENELERVKITSKRRRRKIDILNKRISRLGKKNEGLYSILMKRLSQDNVETEPY